MYYARPFAHIRRKGAEAYDGFSTLPDTIMFNILSDSTDAYSRPPPKVVAAQRFTLIFIPLSLICLFHIQRHKGRNSPANKQIFNNFFTSRIFSGYGFATEGQRTAIHPHIIQIIGISFRKFAQTFRIFRLQIGRSRCPEGDFVD